MSDNIKVVVKIRPLLSREIDDKLPYHWRVHNNTLYQLDSSGRDFGQTFTFDKVYNEATETTDVYDDVAKPIVEAAIKGFNGTIFAYGQTSSGKTYTMTGTDKSPGIIPLAILNLFEIIKNIPDRDFLVRVSYIEIYNETLKDLLDVKKDNIRIHETYEGSIKVDATEKVTASPEEVLEAMREGEANRQTGSTNMNEKSSRSHSIFQITIESREHMEEGQQAGCVNVSQLNLVDLAGSERAGQTGATGLRFKEGTHINKSLSALALVIKQLSEGPNKYANYRDSKLTRILQNSLGGNAKTSIICAVTPAALEETISTLQFATRAKAIKNKPEVNAVATDATMIQSLTKQLCKLQAQLESKKNLEVMLETKKHVEQDLQKQIANLQKLILNGFGQRRSVEHIGGTHRKLQMPRRKTISTLHSFTEESLPPIPNFCTPSLKYNPLVTPNPDSEFVPIQNNKLETLPEEPMQITPPPTNKKAFDNEIIEIDSDEDNSSTMCSLEICSPYHKCRLASKTPPCILRKTAKQAERNYKEIVELTEREKIYKPSVVELMEKLDQRAVIIENLQGEVEMLKGVTKGKDLEIEHLKCKIKQIEDKIKDMTELEIRCKEYDTKLTDWEVSYETLQKKAKLREEELLSLLEEQKHKKYEDIGKLSPTPFLDMSKDISLVNSDNESNVTLHQDDSSEQMQELIASLQDQLIAKSQTIIQLEANIEGQKQSIYFLEKSSREVEELVDNLKEKVNYLENENKLLHSSVDNLNAIIKSQKENLDTAHNDMESYNSLIQELQIKLSKKENISTLNIDDSVLETMIANEEKVIANNENMRNIIYSFKLALERRNKEMEELKSSIEIQKESQDKVIMEDLMVKASQTDALNEEISLLKKQINENITTINNLIREKNNFASAEQQSLTNKIAELENQNSELDKINKEYALSIDNLKETNENNLQLLSDKSIKIEECLNLINRLQSKIEVLSNEVNNMEQDLKTKDNIIKQLNKQSEDKQKYENDAKSALDRLKKLISLLNGEVQEIPDFIDNYLTIFNTLCVALHTLENTVADTISEKEEIVKCNNQLRTETAELKCKYDKEIVNFQLDIENLKKSLENSLFDNTNLKESYERLSNEISEREQDVLRDASARIETLELELKDKCTEISILHQKLSKVTQINDEIVEKLSDISSELMYEDSLSPLDVNVNNHEYILRILDKIVSDVISAKIKNKDYLEHLQCESQRESLLAENQALKDKLSQILRENEIEVEKNNLNIKILNTDLQNSSELLKELREDLETKAAEIEIMKQKATEWKEQFMHLDILMKQQKQSLELENEKLKNRLLELNNDTKMHIDILSKESDDFDSNEDNLAKIAPTPSKNPIDTISPPSLLTICCNTIVEAMEPKHNDYNSVSTSSSDTDVQITTHISGCALCKRLTAELSISQQENHTLSKLVEQLEMTNKELILERETLHQEVQLLLEPAQELQKKISSHKTNLSILTATSYAENKSLKSQVKGLQHHHNRFHTVCERDIPEFKRQLRELLTILKCDASVSDAQYGNLKRFSLPDTFDKNSTLCQFKNESILDGDLLMLDTNVTLTTTGDNTLVGCDHTSLDLTETMYNQEFCQSNDPNQTEPNAMYSHMSILETDSQILLQKIELLKEENCKLKQVLDKVSVAKVTQVDAQISSIKSSDTCYDDNLCKKCKFENTAPKDTTLKEEIGHLNQKIIEIQGEKEEIEKKYNNLLLEVPDVDALVCKSKALEKEFSVKVNEIINLKNIISDKNKEMKRLQEENDSLSSQIMDNIYESEDLNKELDRLKNQNLELNKEIEKLEANSEINSVHCPQCKFKDEHSIQVKTSPHAKLSRSFSDSDSSSTLNKICTLQSELCAGREDCKVLTEHVANIKQHLDCSKMSMDLDESMEDSSVFSLPKDVALNSQDAKCNMPDIQEERPLDLYTLDKNDCCNYYLQITGVEKDHVPNDIKMIDILKMFYNNLVAKHGTQLECLENELKEYQDSQTKLQTQLNEMESKYSTITQAMAEKEQNLDTILKFIHQVKNNVNSINISLAVPNCNESHTEIINAFKEQYLNTLDNEFGMCSSNVFQMIMNKYQNDLIAMEKQCITLQNQTDTLTKDLNTAYGDLADLKCKLSEKVIEYDLLKAQKDKVHEISSAVTLDIIKNKQEMNKTVKDIYQKVLELNLANSTDLNMTESSSENVNVLFDRIISQHKLQQEALPLELAKSKIILSEKEKELSELNVRVQTLTDLNNNVTLELSDKETKFQTLKTAHDDLTKSYESKVQENTDNLALIKKLTEKINDLKETIHSKEVLISSMQEKDDKPLELLQTIKQLQEDNEKLNSVNQMILKEKESYSKDLEKSGQTINQNKAELEKMTSDILVLRESVKESTSIIESLKQDVQRLSAENAKITQEFDERAQECSRLKTNIKTHEKTAEIQSKIIMRLKATKTEDDGLITEKQTKIDELTQMCSSLQCECDELKVAVTSSKEDMDKLMTEKDFLKMRVTELEEAVNKPRLSFDAAPDSSRRRRQSLHDSKRVLLELEERRNLEAVLEKQRCEELFMDVDGEDVSGRSTPFTRGKGRDSLLSRTDQSDKDEDPPSRPSSVQAVRRRRQSAHDLRRAVPAPSPHDLSNKIFDEDLPANRSDNSEVQQLRDQLRSCKIELEDLKERYREVDEECEICAEYLRERDDQCLRLKEEKSALEKQVKELKTKFQKCNLNRSQETQSQPTVVDVAVNTDEDWANLHAVVVDRMSYDAEVEKNKRLTKTVEELRFKKQDLKNTLAKMQKALDKHASKDNNRELEATREELKSVKEELEELKIKYKELDEECETCAEYLKEREDQCQRLKEAKAALESKLQELGKEAHSGAHAQSARKKRQTVHDMNRRPSVDCSDAATETSDDFLSYQVERDDSSDRVTDDMKTYDVKWLKMTVDKLTHQKAVLQKQLRGANLPQPVCVATGSAIVQNQQLTDVMNENQRLKKMNAKLINLCKKRGKSDANQENKCDQGNANY